VLFVLYGHVGEAFYLRQLARHTQIAVGPVQRELRQLVNAGVVTRKVVGVQTLFSANQESLVFAEMKSLVTKTVGMHDVLHAVLDPLRKQINLAFVYGSMARSGETERSDVDLMVIGPSRFQHSRRKAGPENIESGSQSDRVFRKRVQEQDSREFPFPLPARGTSGFCAKQELREQS
jgi:hypothetical protein